MDSPATTGATPTRARGWVSSTMPSASVGAGLRRDAEHHQHGAEHAHYGAYEVMARGPRLGDFIAPSLPRGATTPTRERRHRTVLRNAGLDSSARTARFHAALRVRGLMMPTPTPCATRAGRYASKVCDECRSASSAPARAPFVREKSGEADPRTRSSTTAAAPSWSSWTAAASA